MCALEAEEGFATAEDDVRLFYRISGKGPFALVMPVNWGLDSSLLSKGLGSLEFYLALVTWDPRGVGRSGPARSPPGDFALDVTARDAGSVADAVGLATSVVIGHSSGGAVALIYALRHARRVSRLILVSTAARWYDPFRTEPEVRYPETEAQMRDEFRASLATAVREPAKFQRAMGPLVDRARFSPARYRWTGEVEWSTYDVRDRLHDIRVPTLIVHGRDDRVIAVERAQELHAGIPGSRLEVLEDCGHWPFVEQRDPFVRAAISFLGLEEPSRRRR